MGGLTSNGLPVKDPPSVSNSPWGRGADPWGGERERCEDKAGRSLRGDGQRERQVWVRDNPGPPSCHGGMVERQGALYAGLGRPAACRGVLEGIHACGVQSFYAWGTGTSH